MDYLGNHFQSIFNGNVSPFRYNNELSSWFDVSSGAGQGYIQGPAIFNVCINLAAQHVKMNKIMTNGAVLQKFGTSSYDIDYADDMAMLDNSNDGLQETTDPI